MKKILYYAIASLLTLSSCSMDLNPEGSIPDKDALVSVKDYESFCNGLNSMMRGITSGDYIVLSDIQLDDFNAVIGNGNRRMEFYNGSILPSTGEIGSIYSGYYSAIAQTNFFLGYAVEKMNDASLTEKDKNALKNYVGQAYFFRAYCYNSLADKFCQSYKNCNELDKEGLGLSLQLTYAPTAENDKYPGRSSMKDTYAQILSDLNNAKDLLSEYEKYNNVEPASNAIYVTSDAAKALLARVYLNMGDYKNAADYAQELINSKRYPLIRNKNEFYEMWLNDTGSEVIWMVAADYSHKGAASGSAFCNNDQNPDYVPNNDAIYLFEEVDSRWIAWFDTKGGAQFNISNSGGSASLYLFRKYPGNPSLQDQSSSGSNYINMAKPLRIGEMYLIAAEANYCMGTNGEPDAKKYLSELESARDARGYKASMTGQALFNELCKERRRELMGEGLRMADLKRWNLGFQRSSAFDGHNNVIISNFRNLAYEADDYRLVWPIPQHEIDANPQVAGQQNRGY